MSKKGGFLKGAFIGALLGVAGGVLFAPRKGEETRRDLKVKIDEYGKKISDKATEIAKERDSLESTLQNIGSKIMSNVQQVTESAREIAEKFNEEESSRTPALPTNKEEVKPEVRKRKFFKGIS